MKKVWFRSGAFALVLVMAMVFIGCDNDTVTRSRFDVEDVHETDVVVIGSGGAGLAAAVEALQRGRRVIVLEQLAFTGGNTLVNGGGINAAIVDSNFRTTRPRIQATGQTMTGTEIGFVQRMINMSAHDPEYAWLNLTTAERNAADAAMAPWQATLQQQWNTFVAAGGNAPGGGWFDSPHLHMLQTFESGDFLNKPELVEIMAIGAADAYYWLKDLGATMSQQGGSPGPNLIVGSLWHRNYMLNFSRPGFGGPGEGPVQQLPNEDGLTGGAGVGFVRPQERELLRLGGTRLLNHRATEIITDQSGRAIGVAGVSRYGTFVVRARAVIVATGGFGGNPAMLAQFNPNRQALYMPGLHSGNARFVTQWIDIRNYGTTNMISAATGEGILIAQRAGAALTQMGEIQLLPGSAGGVGGITVCERGLRAMNESGRRDVIALQWISANLARDGRTWNVTGQPAIAATTAGRPHATDEALVARMLANWRYDVPVGGATSELSPANQAFVAQFVPGNALFDEVLANFQETIRNYNASNSLDYYGDPRTPTEVDEAGKEVKGNSLRAPWGFAVTTRPNIHHTMGGIAINARAEALDSDGNPIPGLYAAGEVTGAVHGANRIGGNAVTDIIVFGRAAAVSAVENMRR